MTKQEACIKCKLCCLLIGVLTQHSAYDSSSIEFYKARGFSTLAYKGKLWIYKEDACPHLTETGCGIYESRPTACKMYDGRKDPIVRDRCLWNNL